MQDTMWQTPRISLGFLGAGAGSQTSLVFDDCDSFEGYFPGFCRTPSAEVSDFSHD